MMKKLQIRSLTAGLIAFAMLGLSTLVLSSVDAQAQASFRTGNIVTAVNNTTRDADWGDPVSATPGQVIEFRIFADNTSSVTATNVRVSASLASTPSQSPQATGTVSADNAASVSDTVTINLTGGGLPQGFVYNPGHVRIFSPACPSGCAGSDAIVSGGISVGDLAAGQSAQVLFKAWVDNIVASSPAPSPSASPSVAPSPSVSPSPSPAQGGQTVSCPAGFNQTVQNNTIVCVQQVNTQTQTQTNNQNVNVTQNAAAQPAVAGAVAGAKVTTLPKTGLPVTALIGLGGLPLGLLLRKFRKGPASESDPDSIWEDRQIKLDS